MTQPRNSRLAAIFSLVATSAKISAILALLLAAPGARARTDADLAIDSPALGRPLHYARYRPDQVPADRHLPLLMLLHGVDGSATDWLRDGTIADLLDRAIADGTIPPLEAVMPNAQTSWYVDSAPWHGPGNFETALRVDFESVLASRDRLLPGRAGRAIAGLSMGGFGALRLAALAPEHYCSVAALSPALWNHLTDDSKPPEAARRIFNGSFGDPFDPRRFRRLSPMAILDHLTHSSRPPTLFLAAGDRDFTGILRDTKALGPVLAHDGLRVTTRIYPDGHDWQTWRAAMTDYLPLLGQALRACANEP